MYCGRHAGLLVLAGLPKRQATLMASKLRYWFAENGTPWERLDCRTYVATVFPPEEHEMVFDPIDVLVSYYSELDLRGWWVTTTDTTTASQHRSLFAAMQVAEEMRIERDRILNSPQTDQIPTSSR